ncbi:hypothetical protein KDI_28560 [Dictyobacter arantiisoli]|uniref:Uncharacterized protein n=1 Tax=Dictyobacter arantiisoli TaxID=2014874 RepID=A0A5A5TCW2_9CHLR|nr:hypothetical protein KDI_28560 [Dictyobacter arantiisoli]
MGIFYLLHKSGRSCFSTKVSKNECSYGIIAQCSRSIASNGPMGDFLDSGNNQPKMRTFDDTDPYDDDGDPE